MLTKRIIVWMVLFVLTGIGALQVIWSDSKASNPVFDGFVKVDTSDIEQIRYTYKGTSHTIEVVSPTKWMIDGKYELRPDVIQLIKIGMGRMEPKMAVSNELLTQASQTLNEKGVKLEVQGEEQNTTFIISANPNDQNSSWYTGGGNAQPLVIQVPGFTGDYSTIFRMNVQDLRDPLVFSSSPGSLLELEVSYKDQPKYNFFIRQGERGYEVDGIAKLDTNKLYAYLNLYQQVNVYSYMVDKAKDSVETLLKGKMPEVSIRLKDREIIKSNTLIIYEALPGDKYLYGKIVEKNELVLLSPKTLQYLLVRRDLFMDK
ncbi:MAG: DUF4340 domain-containing protein [Cytophagaceae bacterium]